MGQIQKGILTSIQGTVGSVVGGYWKGKEYIRSKSIRRNKTLSEAQLVQQAKFSTAITFLKKMGKFLEISFRPQANGMSGKNAALSDLLKNAITGTYPNFSIDFSKVRISADTELPEPVAATAASNVPGVVTFNWTDNSTDEGAAASDKAMVVAYCDDLKKGKYNTAAAERSAGTGNLSVPNFSGQAVHTWVVFISEDGREISQGRYTGLVTVQ